jgi:hypothetical protein
MLDSNAYPYNHNQGPSTAEARFRGMSPHPQAALVASTSSRPVVSHRPVLPSTLLLPPMPPPSVSSTSAPLSLTRVVQTCYHSSGHRTQLPAPGP